ncbi:MULTISPECIES: GNAT family N-acetyltransferase [Acinetobacter]|jgi:GNAT superfamily N-acetyltransferase|uniref:Acetyltransferase (GNAT) family protein n=2 Tax=Acinetobacter johnsonii TaxID=40214 RepID=A0A1R7QB98_ACIJO|nr:MULTISPECIES: GNAT family N-acetyltransferase [Acinetobacter]MDA0776668.1 GNAT family N-acetyltransferase [Pseudomonadota bacterium]MDN5444606.1 GNAT family N-acetyltransferase [Pseudomonadales bacterium]NWK50075.1 GNAT family N-acetyltransferase [Acinetobacter sp. SwsAc7]NWK61018.1 GNAT family N-acetyltransferase [Acinetobacter sp. SwsAc3]OYW70123.1 MAG: GNAT family N-acetyltransferase [Pseudomonadales bacterium 32-42-5]
MPITVHAYTSLEKEELRSQLERLYDTSPEFGDGHDAVEQLEQNLAQYTLLYTAEFNTKVIGAIWCSGQGENKTLEYIVVHPANRGRGVAERLVEEVCRMEEAKGVKVFEPGCGAIHRCLEHIGKI